MDSELFYNKLVNNGVNISLEKINEIISKIDIDNIKEDLKKSYKLEIWDKKSPINGVEAEIVLKSKPYEIGSVYLIYVNDKLVYLQDHNPNERGYVKMTKNQAKTIGEQFIERRVGEELNILLYDKILNEINKKEVGK